MSKKLIVTICLLVAFTATTEPAQANGNQLVITGAVPNLEDSILTIVGANFGTNEPDVQLGGAPLTVQTFSPTEIVADLPPIAPGTYLLKVKRGNGKKKRDEFFLSIGAGGPQGDITAVAAGSGLLGGGIAGDVALEVDEGFLDGLYVKTDGSNGGPFARLDIPNDLTGDQRTDGSFIAERSVDEGPAIQGRSFAPGFGIGVLGESNGTDGIALYGRSYSPTGGTLGLHAVVHSPDGTAAAFHNEGDGEILSAGSATYGEVMNLAADGTFNVRHLQTETAQVHSDYEPGPGDQIFVADVSSSALSGHVRGVNSTTFSPDSTAVVGSAQPATGGVGAFFDSYGVGGLGVGGLAQATSGFSNGVLGESQSPDGVGGWFINNAGGRILLGSGPSGEVFRVDGDGSVRASAYFDNFGNPVGLGDVTAVWPGAGLAGGGDFGDLSLEVDEGYLDGLYLRTDGANTPDFARRDEPNNLTGDQVTDGNFDGRRMIANNGTDYDNALHGVTWGLNATSVWGNNESPDFGTGVHGRTSAPDGQGVWAETTSTTGNARALYAVANNPDGVAGVFENNAGGRILSAGGAVYGEVFRVEGDGRVFSQHDGAGSTTLEAIANGSWGRALFGSADHPDFGVGVQGQLNSAEGYALYGIAPQGAGNTRAVFAEVFSPDGTAGYFVNGGGGTILSGHTTGEAQVFSVEADGSIFSQGNVHAAGYFDLFGNPIGADGVGVFEINTGPGLVGGPINDSGTLEVDFGALDGQYARLNAANDFGATNSFHDDVWFNGVSQFNNRVQVGWASDPGGSVVGIGNHTSGGIGLQANAFGPGSRGLVGFGDTGLQAGGVVGVSGSTHELDGVGVLAEATNPGGASIALIAGAASPTALSALLDSSGGRLLEGHAVQTATGNRQLVVQLEADGTLVQNAFGSDLMIGNAWNGGTSSFDEVFRVASDGTVTATAVIETSSKRLKTNVASLSGALAAVQNLRGVSFDWKRDGQHDIGLIAEEVAEVLPEVVEMQDGEAQGVNYGRLTAVLIEAVKEQQSQIDRLEALVEALVSKR